MKTISRIIILLLVSACTHTAVSKKTLAAQGGKAGDSSHSVAVEEPDNLVGLVEPVNVISSAHNTVSKKILPPQGAKEDDSSSHSVVAEVPVNLADLVEVVDGLSCLPKYIYRIRILADGTAVLATWRDPEKRLGRDSHRRRIWLRGEFARDPQRGHKESMGATPTLIDGLGRGWYQPFSTKNQSCYVMLQGKSLQRFDLDGLARSGPPIETKPGLVWIETYAGFTCIRPSGKRREFRFTEHGMTPIAERERRIYGRYGLVQHLDGSVLLFPKLVGTLKNPGEEGGWFKADRECDVWAWYLKDGDPDKARRIDLLGAVSGAVAPLPGGAFRLELFDPDERVKTYLWHPKGKQEITTNPWPQARTIRPFRVHGSPACYLLVIKGKPREEETTLVRLDQDHETTVLCKSFPTTRKPQWGAIPTSFDWSAMLDRLQNANINDPVGVALAHRLTKDLQQTLLQRKLGESLTSKTHEQLQTWLAQLLLDPSLASDDCWEYTGWPKKQIKLLEEYRAEMNPHRPASIRKLNTLLLVEGLSFLLDDFTVLTGQSESLPAVLLPQGGILFSHAYAARGRHGGRERACSVILEGNDLRLFPLTPESSRKRDVSYSTAVKIFDMDAKGCLYYYHWHRGRVVVVPDIRKAPFPIWDFSKTPKRRKKIKKLEETELVDPARLK